MSPIKAGLVALLLVAGFSGSARAQFGVGAGYGSRGYGSPAYGGLGYGYGYGNGYAYGRGYYAPAYVAPPVMYNNLGGLSNVIRQNTGRPGSWKGGSPYGVSSPRIR